MSRDIEVENVYDMIWDGVTSECMMIHDADEMAVIITLVDVLSFAAAAAEEARMESIMLWSMRILPR